VIKNEIMFSNYPAFNISDSFFRVSINTAKKFFMIFIVSFAEVKTLLIYD